MVRFKRSAAVITAALILIMQTVQVFAFPVKNNNNDEKAFKLESVGTCDVLAAKIYVYRHVATGASVQFIKNDDTNKCFMLEFETPVDNNKGTAHVFEHAAANGSAGYPSRSLLSAVSARSYVTFANAMTGDACTVYPVASLSEKQLLKMADLYADICFEPSILTNEDIFRSEAWRLTVDDTGSKLGVRGTIYSEMKRAYNAEDAARRQAMGLLWPGCSSSYVAGGIPEDIITLTYDEVLDFHEKYYTPSNCTAYLYGDIKDAEAFLKLLDGYFDRFDVKADDKRLVISDVGTGFVSQRYDFPAAGISDEDEDSEIVYVIDIGKPDEDDLTGLYALRNCLNREHSYAQMLLRRDFPLSDIGFEIAPEECGFAFAVSACEVDEKDAERLKDCVDDIFKTISEKGIDEDELSNFRRQSGINAALSHEKKNFGINLLTNAANLHSRGLDLMFYPRLQDSFADMSWFTQDTVRSLASEYLAGPKHSAMSVVVPSPHLAEENDKKLEETLDKIRASMSEKDIKRLTEDNKRIEQTKDDPSECLEKLNVVKPSDLTAALKEPEIFDETDESGCRQIRVSTNNDGIDATVIYLDASGLSQDMLGYLALYVDLVNGHFISSKDHSRAQLADLINENTVASATINLNVSSTGKEYVPYVLASFMSAPDTTGQAFELIGERLFECDFSDPTGVKEGISAIKANVAGNIQSNTDNIARYLAYAKDGEGAAYYENTHYIEYLDFLTRLEKDFGGDHKSVCAKLESIGRFLQNRNGAVIAGAVSKKNERAYQKYAISFEENLGSAGHTSCEYKFTKYEYPLAVTTDGMTVSNVIAVGDVGALSEKYGEAALDVTMSVMTDEFVKPVARGRLGAYSVYYGNDIPSICFGTGSDPNTKETMEVFEYMPDACGKYAEGLTDEVISEHILRLYAQNSQSSGEINDALSVINDLVAGKGADRRACYLSELKDITAEDVKECGAIFTVISGEGAVVSAGSKELIEKNREIYARILNPFAK